MARRSETRPRTLLIVVVFVLACVAAALVQYAKGRAGQLPPNPPRSVTGSGRR